MNSNILESLSEIKQYGEKMLCILDAGEDSAEEFGKKAEVMAQVMDAVKSMVPAVIYKEYSEFFQSFSVFCKQCENPDFLTKNVDTMASSLALFVECMEEIKDNVRNRVKKCSCCGNEVVYHPISSYYSAIRKNMGIISNAKYETINRDEYNCPVCGASDRDRLMISFLQKEGLQEAAEGTKLLQFAPAEAVSRWIVMNCPQVEYETTDLYMENVSFQSDIMNMHMVADNTYDVIICSHVLEHVQDDRKALSEMKRILKPDGKILFLVPIDLNSSDIDEEWGLSAEENWKRFGQGDHCRRYGKDGLLRRLEEQFYVHSLGKDYFGDEVFFQGGLIDTSTLYILTGSQEIPLNLAETVVIDEKLCTQGPLVSVIMSCYNHGMFVADAIESVINQSYKNIEFLVADDGSNDTSVSVMKKYSSHFAKEFYFEDNAGGRFQLLKQCAKGKYIALINSDDVWMKDKLAMQVEYMEKHAECGACFTWCKYTNETLEDLEDNFFIKRNRSSSEWMRYFWESGNALCNSSSLIRKELSLKTPRYGSTCWQLPDFFKWIDLIQNDSLYIIPKVMTKMRRYKKEGVANTSALSNENMVRDFVERGNNWFWVIGDMQGDFFKKSFRELMINPAADTEQEITCEKYFLMLGSQNIFLQNNAICYMAKIYNDVKECLEEKYHYTIKDFKDDMTRKGFAGAFIKNEVDKG